MFEIGDKKYASQEEWEFECWLEEAKKYGIVYNYIYQPEAFCLSPRQSVQVEKQLKTKTKMVDKFLLHPHKYTPDYVFVMDEILTWNHGLLSATPGTGNEYGRDVFYIDVKGAFGGQFGSAREFSINQKWVYKEHGIYINSLTPQKFFAKTWLPERMLFTVRTGKPTKSKKWRGLKTYREIQDDNCSEL